MQIKLSQSEIVEIVRQHLTKKNIDAGDLDVTSENSELVIVAHDVTLVQPATGTIHPKKPFVQRTLDPEDFVKKIILKNNGMNWNQTKGTTTNTLDELTDMLGDVFTAFNQTLTSSKKDKQESDAKDSDNPFTPRDMK